jgi:hypothetical protein
LKKKPKKNVMDRCLLWFSAFFFGAKVSVTKNSLKQKPQSFPVDYCSLLNQLDVVLTDETICVIGITDLDICDEETEST